MRFYGKVSNQQNNRDKKLKYTGIERAQIRRDDRWEKEGLTRAVDSFVVLWSRLEQSVNSSRISAMQSAAAAAAVS